MRSAMTLMTLTVSVCFVLLVGPVALAQRIGESLSGMVRVKTNGDAPPAIRIRLQKFGATISEMSPRDGRFEFANIGSGRYTLVVDAPGYETVYQNVDLPGEWFTFIELLPKQRDVRRTEVRPIWELRIPEAARRQFTAGRKKLAENRCEEAVDYLRKAIHTYAEYGDAHRAMGECYVRMEQLEAAETEFKRALEQPHSPDLHLLLARVYALQADNEGLSARQVELYVAEEKPGPMRDRMVDLLNRYGKR